MSVYRHLHLLFLQRALSCVSLLTHRLCPVIGHSLAACYQIRYIVFYDIPGGSVVSMRLRCAHHMSVVLEGLDVALARIAAQGDGDVTRHVRL